MAHTEFPGGFGFPACDESAPYIFVSYAHRDAERIAPFVRYLNDNGVRIWYDSGLHAGEEWLNMLLGKISSDSCTAVMFFVSDESIGRPFVRAETHHAFSMKKPIYAVYLDDGVVLDASMNAYIGQIQSTFIPRHSDPASAKEEMLAAARLLIERTPPMAKTDAGSGIDQLCREAEILLGQRNAQGEFSGIEQADAKYRTITERYSNDCRGWLGLMRCRSMTTPSSPEHAAKLLADCNNYYCYAINCEPDETALRQCEEYINRLWTATLDMFDSLAASTKDAQTLSELYSKLPDSRLLTSVSPAVTTRYAELEGRLKATAASAASRNKIARGIKRTLAAIDVCLYSLISILIIISCSSDMRYVLTHPSSLSGRHTVPVYIAGICATVVMLAIHYVAAAIVRKHAKAGKAVPLYRFAAAVMAIGWLFLFLLFVFM